LPQGDARGGARVELPNTEGRGRSPTRWNGVARKGARLLPSLMWFRTQTYLVQRPAFNIVRPVERSEELLYWRLLDWVLREIRLSLACAHQTGGV